MRVYFLPYIASMWRSMEPLYKEHKKAGDDVTVMPIPYYSRDVNGDLANYHYDYGFPVPVKDYKTVNLMQVHPDIIYFHNPYDENNRVTSVDPSYYSYKLKPCTDRLIYTPYYTLSSGDNDITAGSVSGIYNADAIVTWSEKQAENFRQYHPNKEIIVKKRPKLKKKAIPKEWEDIINGRRVVFLNNSLGALIMDPLKELHSLGKAMQTYRTDCIWWRPHPLFEETIQAICPQYKPLYGDIMARFQRINGIYDTSWDVERAAVRADIYVGDPSSVEVLFYEQGKKVIRL